MTSPVPPCLSDFVSGRLDALEQWTKEMAAHVQEYGALGGLPVEQLLANELSLVFAAKKIAQEYAARDEDVDLMLGPTTTRQMEWSGLHLAMRVLAGVFYNHPDYQEDWKP